MKIYVIFLCLFMLVLSGCDGRSKESRIMHQLEREVVDEINSKYGLFLVGFSKEGPTYNLKMCERIGLTFGTYRIIQKEEGRKILFEISDALLKKINAHEEFRTYMTDWPVTVKNLKLSIIVYESPGTEWNYENITYFYLNDRGVTFSYNIPNESFRMFDINETLEEARAKLNQNS